MTTTIPLESEDAQSVFEFSARDIEGTERPLRTFEGKVLLIVNVASNCGFTSQYSGLQRLQRDLAARGFSVLGFPCNQFGGQEPGNEREIRDFCQTHYEVSFPMFAKVEVNGDRTHPLYTFLKRGSKGVLGTEAIKWNFTKFLVDRSGKVVARFAPTTSPESLVAEIEKLL